MSKFAWYVCMCMYVYIWYMYMYIYGCADDCNKLSSITISYYVCEKEVTDNPSVRREDGHGECSVSLAAVLLAITNMARCRRLRVVTVIDIICHCCCCFCCFSPSQKQCLYQYLNKQIMTLFCSLPYFLYDTYHFICMIGPLLKWTYHQLSNVERPPGGHCWNTYLRWVEALRFIGGSGTRIFHLRMSGPQMGSGVSPVNKDATVVVPAVAAVGRHPSSESCIMYSLTACACYSSSGSPHASGQIWP